MRKMPFRNIFFGITAIVSMILSVVPSYGKNLVLVTGEWAPYTSVKIQGYGLCSEIASAVVEEMGMKPEIQFYPWKRCEMMVEDGSAWACMPYYVNDERLKTFAYTDIVMPSRSVFFYYKDRMKGFEWNVYDDLKPYKFGGVLGYGTHEELQRNGLNVDFVRTEEQNFKKIIAGRIDMFSLDELVGKALIKAKFSESAANFHSLAKPESESPLHLMVLKRNPESMELVQQFNKALASIKEKGIYKTLLAKYNVAE